MSSTFGSIEAIVVVLAGAAAVAFLAFALINGENAHAIYALVAYLVVWVYGLMRAAYTEAPPSSG